MIHARKDYNRIQDPALDNPELYPDCSPIAEDEPVMLFRAKDQFFESVLNSYLTMLGEQAEPHMVQALKDHNKLARNWQRRNVTKFPDIPKPE